MPNFADVPFPARVKQCAVEMAQRGVAALADLFDLVAPRSVRFAQALTRNQHDAEDALQAAFVRLALYPRGLVEAQHPWAYLLRIVRNEAIKIAQKKRAEDWLEMVAETWREEAIPDFEAVQLVRLALEKLPPSQSEVVVLKVWEGMTFAEIADVLGESPNTAASRYRYALQKLTQYLQPLAVEGRYA
ncbi:MAG: sigma-70 family RNA polymerase sigma factor [Planctomycetes bacterium]|nr:sigma-70 family RNA polymerase sigma factor [Planctomycetota bacterium]